MNADGSQTLHGAEARFGSGLHELAPQTWAWLQPNGELGESNAGVVASGAHVLLIDTLWDVKLTAEMLRSARAAGIGEPTIVFNTHSDGDHFWGNQLVADAEIISTAAAKQLMTLDPPSEMRRTRAGGMLLGRIGSLPLPLIGTLKLAGLPRLPLREIGSMMAPFDWRGIELTLPKRTFSGRLELEVGDRRAELIEVGPAHTAGDAVAWLPDVSVCFAADVLFIDCTPIMWAGPVAGWQRALETLIDLGAKTYVPGHGPICSVAELHLLSDYFDWVTSEGIGRLDRGIKPIAAAREMLLSTDFASLPWAGWDDQARLAITLTTEQTLRAGGQTPLGGLRRARAITAMQRLQAELDDRNDPIPTRKADR